MKRSFLSLLILGLSAPALAIVMSAEPTPHSNIDTSIVGPVNQELKLPARSAPVTAVTRQSSSLPLDRYDDQLGVATFRWNRESLRAPNFRGVDNEARSRHAATHYLEQMTGVGLMAKKQDERAVLTSLHDMGRGPIIAKFSQEFSGVEVFNRELNAVSYTHLRAHETP